MRNHRGGARWVKLELERLENREAPSVTPWITQSFEGILVTSPPGSPPPIPPDWSQWNSDGHTTFAVTSAKSSSHPALSGTQSLSVMSGSNGGSGDVSRAWLDQTLPADIELTAAVYVNSLIPAQVVARGSNLDTPDSQSGGPSFYAVELSSGSPGPRLQLVKDVNGTQSTLATINAPSYVSNYWLEETLDVEGTTVRAQLFDPKTGEYLNSSGHWQTSQAWALTVIDSSISGPGFVGLGRPASYVGTVTFDDVSVQALPRDAQSFDSTPAGSLPTGWQQWSSNGKNSYFSVSASTTNFLSANNVLASAEMSNTVAAAAWDTNPNDELTNAQVTAAAYVATGMPTIRLAARGTNLGSTTPNYYGLSILGNEVGGVSNLSVDLVRVNNGVETTLAQFQAPGYINTWVQETLYVDGDNLRVSIYRTDTGEYLNSDGLWQPLPTYVINTTDTSSAALTGPGVVGFVRPSGSSYSVQPGDLDNFAVTPLSVDSTPPSVTVSVPSGTLTGAVSITATPTEPAPTYSITQVAFYIDDNPNYPILDYVATTSPYTWHLDTNSLSNGTHTLLVIATDNEGNIGTATTTITTSNNTTLSMPTGFPAHPNTVGIAELDYSYNDANQTLVQNYVDVTVDGGGDVTNIHNWDPSVQQLLYTNISNIYTGSINVVNIPSSDPLLSFLNYAEANGLNPEGAFYHVAIATSYSSGSSHSTLPVDEFWGVYDANGNNDTASAYSGGAIPFGSRVNQADYIGYLEPYWEINFNVTSAASGGWSYVLEYPTAVDSNHNPTAWATLPTLSNTAGRFIGTGPSQITFNPPTNWVPASIDGSLPMYYVRIRTVTAGTAPVASTIKGDNYTNSPVSSNGTSGVIPAYDWALDPSGGYLDPQEYAIAAAAGYTAHFGYQSRLFYDGASRLYTNPANPLFKAWALSYYPSLLTGTLYNGFFVDNSAGIPPDQFIYNVEGYGLKSGGVFTSVIEPTGAYNLDYAALLNEIGQQLAPHDEWIMVNAGVSQQPPGSTQAGQSYDDAVISKVQAYYDEMDLQALAQNTSSYLTLYSQVYYRATTDQTKYAVIDSESRNGSEQDGQTQLTTLAAYYILAPNSASQGALDFFGGEAPGSAWVSTGGPPPQFNHWSEAASYNIGTPDSSLPSTPDVFASGQETDGSTYEVFDRKFTGPSGGPPVLVLYKPLSTSRATGSGTATTVTLGGSYYLLQADGALASTAQTTISLMNGEGAILVQAGTSAPATATAAVMNANLPASSSSVPPSNASPTGREPLAAASFERLLAGSYVPNLAGTGLSANPSDASAALDYFLSLWAVENMTAFHTGGNGPATNGPIESSRAAMTAPVPPAGISFGPLRMSKVYNNYSFDESTSPVDEMVAGSRVDDPLAPSSAS